MDAFLRARAAISAALPEMHYFKWTHFYERALLFPQRCCQGHGAAKATSRWTSVSTRLAAGLLCRAARLVTLGGEGGGTTAANGSAAAGNNLSGFAVKLARGKGALKSL